MLVAIVYGYRNTVSRASGAADACSGKHVESTEDEFRGGSPQVPTPATDH